MREKAFGHRAKTRLFALLGAMALAGGSVGLAACGDDDDDEAVEEGPRSRAAR